MLGSFGELGKHLEELGDVVHAWQADPERFGAWRTVALATEVAAELADSADDFADRRFFLWWHRRLVKKAIKGLPLIVREVDRTR